MFNLNLTKLAEDEFIVFGPARKAMESKLTVKEDQDPSKISHTSYRSVCITNSRVIIESGDSVIHFPNKDIHQVLISKTKKKDNLRQINILKIITKPGNSIKVNISSIELEKAKQIGNIFPNATIKESRGLIKFLDKILES